MRDTYFITDLLRTNNNSVLIGNVDFGAAMATTGLINFFHSSSNFITTFQSGNATADATYTLPTALPASTGFLQSTSAGILSWQTSSSLGANDGTITDPGMYFVTESDNGFWRPSANTINYASNSRNNLTMSNTLTQTWNRLRILMSAVAGNSATAAAGGTLPNNTYYYKIWSYDVNDVPGIPSPEMSVTTSGGNGTVNLSWTAVTGASYYRISRGTSTGGSDGYYQTSSTSYSDTGASFTGAGNGVQNNDGHIITPGTIDLASGIGSIRWYNWTNGSIGASISGTSAGELEFATGKGGAQGNIIFANSNYVQKVKISTESTPVTFLFSDSSDTIDGRFSADTLDFRMGSLGSPVTVATLTDALYDIDVKLKAKGTSTNDNADAGDYGETSTSSQSTYTNFPTSAQYGDFLSLSLTAGDWLVSIVGSAKANGATVTGMDIGISTTSGNSATGLNLGENLVNLVYPVAGGSPSAASIPSYRMSLSATTTVYFKYSSTYSVATPQLTGRITAVRIR